MIASFLPVHFHFLRPIWLLALIPVALIVAFALRQGANAGAEAWARFVDPHLLGHLTQHGTASNHSRALAATLGVALCAAILGLAGPTWRQIPTPTYESGSPTVIALSLAQSMNTTDITPSRLTRAVHKLRDILARSKDDDVGLVIFSDTAFTAAPLTNDASVIKAMLPELSANLMPVLGNRPDLAIAQSQQLLKEAGAPEGRIVLIADNAGADPGQSRTAARAAEKAGYRVEVLGVGTKEGGTLQTASGQAITDRGGKVMKAGFDPDVLRAIAAAGGGHFATITAGDGDLNRLMPSAKSALHAAGRKQDIKADRWQDIGYLLLIIPVLLAPLAFRRGLLFALAMVAMGFGMPPTKAAAGAWQDLWQTPNQQGQKAFNAGAYDKAVKAFETPGWRGSAAYRKGDYAAAAQDFSTTNAPAAAYNLGNALARQGKLKEALKAYDEALAKAPGDEDTTFNRDLVKKLLEQQKEQQKQSKGGQGKQNQKPQKGQGGQPSKGKQDGQAQKQPQEGQQGGKQGQQNAQSGAQKQSAKQAQGSGGAKQGQKQAKATPRPQQAQDDTTTKAEKQARSGQHGQQQQAQTRAQTRAQAQKHPEESGLSGLLDRALSGNGEKPKSKPQAKSNGPAHSKLDQNAQQQLRRVPDDPSGLLRARIRQYYAQRRANGGN
ncbi:tetratricopeptide repeat protein [Aquicoccus sp. G2-2]|uniref:tetratricopeptide repeat protein n=1 Tax=Aquicoccus sp. G2-2 TaxID=3092120 RepID=UPI002AE0ACAF|nr:tetratricopeptide repeat protein [Aquicoccus sp. G2-2]MEA1114854.1 tetratricopeptide repeat protein [Aquicoccus sp. G2-2]